MTQFYKHHVSQVSDFAKFKTEFIIVLDEQMSYMGADYGPPDPPPSMETMNYVSVIAIENQEQLQEWVQQNQGNRYPKAFKIFRIAPVNVTTEVVVKFN